MTAHLWTGGANGLLLHRTNESRWEEVPGIDWTIHKIHGSSHDNVYFLGDNKVAKWDGSNIVHLPDPGVSFLQHSMGLFVRGVDDVIIAGLTSARWDGSQWLSITVPWWFDCRDIWSVGPEIFRALSGYSGSGFHRSYLFDLVGNEWVQIAYLDSNYNARCAHGYGLEEFQQAYAAHHLANRWTGTAWSSWTAGSVPQARAWLGVYCNPDRIWFVGKGENAGEPILCRVVFPSSNIDLIVPPSTTEHPCTGYHGVYGIVASGVGDGAWIVGEAGDKGYICYYRNNNAIYNELNADEQLYTIWGIGEWEHVAPDEPQFLLSNPSSRNSILRAVTKPKPTSTIPSPTISIEINLTPLSSTELLCTFSVPVGDSQALRSLENYEITPNLQLLSIDVLSPTQLKLTTSEQTQGQSYNLKLHRIG
jgi:hypothetical protein